MRTMDVVGLEKVSFGEKTSFTLIVVYSYLCSALTHARKKNDRASGLHEIVVINGARIAMKKWREAFCACDFWPQAVPY